MPEPEFLTEDAALSREREEIRGVAVHAEVLLFRHTDVCRLDAIPVSECVFEGKSGTEELQHATRDLHP